MTIQSQTCKVQYQANGSNKVFVVPFYFFDEEIAVYINTSDTALIKNTDYTVSGGGDTDGGEITFKTAPTVDDTITIIRDVELNQEVSFLEGEDFPAQDYEYSLDRIIMCLQQLKDNLSRAITSSPGSDTSSEELTTTINFISDNFELLSSLSEISDKIDEIYQNLDDNNITTTNTVEENSTYAITSGGVYSYLNQSYDTSDEVDEKIEANATLKFDEISISIDDIEEDTTYTAYPYKIDVTIDDALETHCPTVILGVTEATSGNFAPISNSFAGYISLYLKEIPEDEFSDTITVVLH